MPGPTELPQLVTEFVDLSKEYMRQETLEPAKALGRYAGMTIGSAVLIAIGMFLLSLGVTRTIIGALGADKTGWSALGYLLGVVAIVAVIGAMVGLAASASESKEG